MFEHDQLKHIKHELQFIFNAIETKEYQLDDDYSDYITKRFFKLKPLVMPDIIKYVIDQKHPLNFTNIPKAEMSEWDESEGIKDEQKTQSCNCGCHNLMARCKDVRWVNGIQVRGCCKFHDTCIVNKL